MDLFIDFGLAGTERGPSGNGTLASHLGLPEAESVPPPYLGLPAKSPVTNVY